MNIYILLALLSAISMASSGVIARLSAIAAAELTFYRLFIGAVCLLGLLILRGQLAQLRQLPDRRMLLNGVLLAGFMLAFLHAIQYISLANAIMLVYLAPALSAVVAHCCLAEPLDKTSSLLILLSLFGFAMLQQFRLDLALDSTQLPGLLFGLLSLFAYSGFLLANRHSGRSDSPLQRSFYQLLIGACCVLPFLSQLPLPSAANWHWALLAGLFPGCLAIYFAVIALEHLPTRVFGTLAYIEPVAVILAGWLLFAEPLGLLQSAGVLLILLAGFVQSSLHQRQQATEQA